MSDSDDQDGFSHHAVNDPVGKTVCAATAGATGELDPCIRVFEDSANGLLSARGAGVDVLITVNDYTRDQDFAGAAAVLDGLGEPDYPCHRLAGDLDPAGMVNMAFLRRVHAHARTARRAAGGTEARG